MDGIGKKIKKGVAWTTIDFGLKAGLQIVIQIILARLLVPADFGLIGMAVVFTAIIRAFVEFGMGAALIQMKEEELSENYLNTAFWSGLGLNVIVYAIVVLVIGPFAASFYGEPLLIKIFPVLSLNILVNSFNMVQLVKLTRKLDFKSLAMVNSVSTTGASVVSVVLAYLGFGVWSIAVHAPLIAIFALPMYLVINKWVPKLHWDKAEFKKIFSFGIFTSGTQLVNNITSQADYLLIGKILDKQQLGIYSLAFQITNDLKTKIVAVVSKVMYPIYSKFQDDRMKIRLFYGSIVKFNFLVIAPLMAFIILYADFFVLELFGEDWSESVPVIQVLGLASIIYTLGSSNTSLIRGMGYPNLEFKIQLGKTVFLYVPSIIVGTFYFGIMGAAYAIVFNGAVSILIAMFFMHKLTGFRYRDLFDSVYKTFFVVGIGVGTFHLGRFFQLSSYLSMPIYIMVVLFFTYVFNKKDIHLLLGRNKGNKQSASLVYSNNKI